MEKKKKSKFNVIFERGAKEYADRITTHSEQTMKEQGVEMSESMKKSMYELVYNSFIAGESYMFQALLAEQTKKPR